MHTSERRTRVCECRLWYNMHLCIYGSVCVCVCVTLHEDTHTQTELERHIRVRLFNNRLSLPLTAALLQQCTLGKKTKKYISISKTNRLIPDDFNSALPQWHKLSKAAIQLIAAAQTKTNRPGERRRNLSEEAENDPRSA